MEGQIKLGAVGDIRPYIIDNLRSYARSNANQLAAKLGTGAGDYADLTSWTATTMSDWQAGVGKKDFEAGGFLYSECETRWPERLILPPALLPATQADTTNYPLNTGFAPGVLKAESTLAVGTTQTVQRIAKAITGNGTKLIGVFLSLKNDDDVFTVNVALYDDNSGVPDTQLELVSEILDGTLGYGNHYIPFTTDLVDGTTYHIVIYPTNAGEVIYLPVDMSTEDATLDGISTYDGVSWTGNANVGRPLIEPIMGMPPATEMINRIIYFPGAGFMYAASGDTLYKQESDTDVWEAVAYTGVTTAFPADITDLQTDGDVLYVGLGDSNNFYTMDASEVFTARTVPARLLHFFRGLLWVATNNSVSYTSDLLTYTGPIEVSPSGYNINAMSGQQDYLFCACDDGLYYVGFGDQVLPVTPWNQIDLTAHHGAGMLNWQGALYIPLAQGIIRYDASTMLPVGPDLGEGLPIFRAGPVGALAAQNNWLFCIVRANAGQSTVWAYGGQGWHFSAIIPSADLLYFTSIFYRRDNRRLYLGTNAGAIFYLTTPDSPNNADQNAFTYTATYGWLETDWFFGGLKDVDKDFESVYISGENIDTLYPVRVYWQDDESEDWEYLGEITSNRQELRWTDYSTRPNSKQLKIGLGLYAKQSLFVEATPTIRGIRIKFHNMVTDTWRWTFSVRVADSLTMADGAVNTYTGAQMRTHLDALTKQVPPVIFQDLDPDQTQYEVKVIEATRVIDKWEIVDGSIISSDIYRVTLEQVTRDAYTP